jgi:hypothetical protein
MLEDKENNQTTIPKAGVKTPEGKAISRYNAQKHAILRETATEYEKADVETIYNELSESFKSINRLQELFIEIIASNVLRLQRIAKAEAELIKEAMSPEVGMMLEPTNGKVYQPKVSSIIMEKLSLYSRYQTATENRIYRSLIILKQFQNHE